MRASNLLPARVPRALTRIRRRIATALDGVPFLFIGIVLGVTVLFVLAIEAIRPGSTDADAMAQAVAPHEPPAPDKTPGPRRDPSVEAPRAAAAAPPSTPARSTPRARPAIPKRKPRTQGRR